jgi:transcriptional regulator PpsR
MNIEKFDADTLARLIGIASDIALIMDNQGVVQDVSVRKSELAVLGCQNWVGKAWADLVTSESRIKVEDMLANNAPEGDIRWRHVNHATPQGVDVPIQYAVLRLEMDGRILALGRDLEAVAVLQRRLVETQQSMERDYFRLRHIEARYRTLFNTTSEPLLVLDGSTYRVTEVNVSAQAMVKDSSKRLVGRDIADCFEPGWKEEVMSLLRRAYATGRIEMCRARFLGANADCTVSATVFRQETGAQFLVRLLQHEASSGPSGSRQNYWITEAMEHAPVGIVLTDRSGQLKSANTEFLAMMGATSVSHVQGVPMENWLVRGGVDWGVLSTNLRQQALVKDFATELRMLSGTELAVEISALSLTHLDELQYAFFIKDVARRRAQETPSASAGMAGSVAELSRLVGRMPLKDIVGETVDMIEKMCIQSALTLTHNNRASASEMLGLSRQSLYVKLRRYGMVSDQDAE